MSQIPTAGDVARTGEMSDLAARNRTVTRGYHLFSTHLAGYLGEEVTWPTLACWASAQAGSTIQKEDLQRALARRLGDSAAIRRLVDGPFRLTGAFVLESLLRLNPFERSSQAVSRGNIKVYVEIGDAFARFLPLLDSGADAEEHEAFLGTLRPGPPPDGQEQLRQAFRAYRRAIQKPAGKERCELVLLGNLSIGFHEQTRLQPEIVASIDGAVRDGVEIKERLFDVLLPHLAHVRQGLAAAALRALAEPLLTPLVEEAQTAIREIVTESLMVLELPGETLRLGRDISGAFPELLRRIDSAEARALLALVDPTPDSMRQSAAVNWADFPERMHFIADLFRSHQRTPRLFEAPAGCV